jgi:hypothetical protein
MKRKFAKNYNIMRNLVFNPRTPLDLSLGLMKNLLTARPEESVGQQRGFGHDSQDGAADVQAEDGKERNLNWTNRRLQQSRSSD